MEGKKYYKLYITDIEDDEGKYGIDLDVPEEHLKMVLDLSLEMGHKVEIMLMIDEEEHRNN